jgi:putative nucleotidyltransferase with HDIG domain
MYRARQFRQALRERPNKNSEEFVSAHLDDRTLALFHAMSLRDQAHSVATAQRLPTTVAADPNVLEAALLHDVGKGRQTAVQRAVYVLLAAVDPAALDRLARRGEGIRGALYRSLHHPALGSDMAERAGCARRVCDLIALHHREPADEDCRALQQADDVA